MTLILGLSGKKQSGKSSLALYLKTYFDLKLNRIIFSPDQILQSENGEEIVLSNIVKERWSMRFLSNYDIGKSGSSVRIYSFADPIKTFCIDVLGIKREQVYGTDEEKNVPTMYNWSTVPSFLNPEQRKGQMTARMVMQLFGTEIMRNIFSPLVWVNACLRSIQKDKPEIAIIADLRFPSEMEPVMNAGGYVVRLDRKPFSDNHPSETSLDDYDWKSNPRAFFVEDGVTLREKNELVRNWIDGILINLKKEEEVTNVGSCN